MAHYRDTDDVAEIVFPANHTISRTLSQHRVWLLTLLKGLAQAKIIKKSMILFWLLNMTI